MLNQFLLVLLVVQIALAVGIVSKVAYAILTDEDRGLLHPKWIRRQRVEKARQNSRP